MSKQRKIAPSISAPLTAHSTGPPWRLFYLPCYSPELNPEERLNADLKQAMGKRVPLRSKTLNAL